MKSCVIPGSGFEKIIHQVSNGKTFIVEQSNSIGDLVDMLCEVNLKQWHLEDVARSQNLSPQEALSILRSLQKSNHSRIRTIEYIDKAYLKTITNNIVRPQPVLPEIQILYHETPGQLLDILSILYIRYYHFGLEKSIKIDGGEGHIKNAIKAIQKQINLCEASFCNLVELLQNNQVVIPPYQRFKLYG